MALFLAPIINDQQEDANGAPLSGGTIEVYLAGTSTPSTTYSDKAGLVPNTWPIVLNTLGVNNQGAVWLTGGASYKFIIKDSVGIVQRTIDNVSGINDTVVTNDQWVVYQGVPTYVSATSFTVVGDQTQIFQVNRRVQTQNTGGIVYSTITASAYVAPNTTVTVRNDSGVLDAGLSQVSYGLISIQNSSVTGLLLNVRKFTANGPYTPTPGTTSIIVEMIGGGGGGAGGSATAAGQVSVGGGGGGGAYSVGRFTSGFSGQIVTVGAAGGGSGLGGGGTAGTASSLGGLITAPGGGGGLASIAGAVTITGGGVGGGVGVGGNIQQSAGAAAQAAIARFSDGAVIGGISVYTKFGGPSTAANVTTAGNASGTNAPAASYGVGGGGSASGASQGGAVGGSGAPGVVIIYEYA